MSGGFGSRYIFGPRIKKSRVVPVHEDDEIRPSSSSDASESIEQDPTGSELTWIPQTQLELNGLLLNPSREIVDQFGDLRQRMDTRLHQTHSERVSHQLPFESRVIQLDPKPLGKSATSVIALVSSDKRWVIKYSAYCRNEHEFLDPVEPTLVEAWFLERLMTLDPGLAPRLLYYSSGARNPLAAQEFPKDRTKICYPQDESSESRTNFSIFTTKSNLPTVRYLITERFGISAWKYWAVYKRKNIEFFDAIRMGGQMLELLERLHVHGFIHGDVHLGNFAVRGNKFGLIDFGRARILNKAEIEANPVYPYQDPLDPIIEGEEFWFHHYLSKWEIRWNRPAFRDDVYRAMQMMAILIHGDFYSSCLEWMADSDSRSDSELVEFIRFKDEGNMFDAELMCPDDMDDLKHTIEQFEPEIVIRDAGISLTQYTISSISASLTRINLIINDPALTQSSKPNYEAIHWELKNIIKHDQTAPIPRSNDPDADAFYIYDIPDLIYFAPS